MIKTDAGNDIYYVATILEFTARQTKNTPSDIAEILGIDGISAIYNLADVNHCLSFEQVSSELIDRYHIPIGSHELNAPDGIKKPSVLDIGENYAKLVISTEADPSKYPQQLYKILRSKISVWMDDYSSAFFYSPDDYILYRYNNFCRTD